jgi:hypothetical protein
MYMALLRTMSPGGLLEAEALKCRSAAALKRRSAAVPKRRSAEAPTRRRADAPTRRRADRRWTRTKEGPHRGPLVAQRYGNKCLRYCQAPSHDATPRLADEARNHFALAREYEYKDLHKHTTLRSRRRRGAQVRVPVIAQ